MLYKGKQFETDIRKLKELSATRKKNPKKNTAEYMKFRDSLAAKYKVSLRAVQLWNKKKSAWNRKKRDDEGKVRSRLPSGVTNKLNDLLDSNFSQKEAREIINNAAKGKKLSKRQLDRILQSKEQPKKEEPAYGDAFKEFLTNHFQLDYIPPQKGIKLKFKKFSFVVTRSDANDIIMVLSNAFNRSQFAQENKLKFDRNYLRRVRTWHIFEQLLTLATERLDQKTFNTLTLAMQRLEIDPAKFANPNFKTLESICKELKPDITFDEIYDMLEKYITGQ